MLRYAEKHPEIKWVFKPHPILRGMLSQYGIMTKKEADEYYHRWERIGLVCYDSAYQELFLESRVMITDSGSFLPEYGATGRPIVRLICEKNKHVPPKIAKEVYDTYYQVHNIDELHSTLKMVVEDGRDPNREVRLAAINRAGLMTQNASDNIVRKLQSVYGRRKA